MDNFLNFISNIELPNNLYFSHFWSQITFEMVLKFSVIYFCIVWIAIIVWVLRDITNRTENVFFQLFCLILVFIFTPLGVFLYLLIRPGRTLFEKYYDEIENNLDTFSEIIEDKVKTSEVNITCFSCKYPISPDFKYCPHCKESLKTSCLECKKSIYKGWEICPYCGVDNAFKESKKVETKKIDTSKKSK